MKRLFCEASFRPRSNVHHVERPIDTSFFCVGHLFMTGQLREDVTTLRVESSLPKKKKLTDAVVKNGNVYNSALVPTVLD